MRMHRSLLAALTALSTSLALLAGCAGRSADVASANGPAGAPAGAQEVSASPAAAGEAGPADDGATFLGPAGPPGAAPPAPVEAAPMPESAAPPPPAAAPAQGRFEAQSAAPPRSPPRSAPPAKRPATASATPRPAATSRPAGDTTVRGGASGATKPRDPVAPRPKKEASKEMAPDPAARPGLGTEWGESRVSRVSTVPFVRSDPLRPFATVALFYNDEQGARAMAGSAGFQRTSARAFAFADGAVSLGLRADTGGFLSGFLAGDKSYVVGEAGRRYSIVIRNHTAGRLECVVSVDGLDVLDGKPAAFTKRGYLVGPGQELEIDGFRQSLESVAAFRFGSVRGSYANQKHGDTRNVGVIGVALFQERGASPWTPDQVQRRREANPFPGNP